jgi:elongation factor Ts
MSITLDQIKELRERTGVSTMACKKALEEAGGDMEAAIDGLRKKGEAKAASRSARTTANGVVAKASSGDKSAVLALLCETDFVAKNDDFKALAVTLAEKLLNGELSMDASEAPDELKEAFVKLGENIQIGDKKIVEGNMIGSYVHSNNRIGVLVSLEGGNEELAKDISMHVAATNPQCTSPDEVSDELVEKEKEIWKDQLAQEGKPAEIMDKIMMGKEKKFREENALVKQTFVKDPEKTIEQLLQEASATVKDFARVEV